MDINCSLWDSNKNKLIMKEDLTKITVTLIISFIFLLLKSFVFMALFNAVFPLHAISYVTAFIVTLSIRFIVR